MVGVGLRRFTHLKRGTGPRAALQTENAFGKSGEEQPPFNRQKPHAEPGPCDRLGGGGRPGGPGDGERDRGVRGRVGWKTEQRPQGPGREGSGSGSRTGPEEGEVADPAHGLWGRG